MDDRDIYTLEDWREQVRMGCFNEYDGSGIWLDANKERVKPFDHPVWDDVFTKPPTGAVYVEWFNK